MTSMVGGKDLLEDLRRLAQSEPVGEVAAKAGCRVSVLRDFMEGRDSALTLTEASALAGAYKARLCKPTVEELS
jgi:hypothetical protein